MTSVVFENRYEVPPDYAAKWLTDFRSDDAARYFGGKAGVTVTRKGREVHSEGPHVMGWAKGVVTLDSPTAWRARNVFSKTPGGPAIMNGTVRETVRADGQGTMHRAEVGVEPLTLGMKVMFRLMGQRMMRRSLADGFVKVKAEMEAQYKAGKPPTE